MILFLFLKGPLVYLVRFNFFYSQTLFNDHILKGPPGYPGSKGDKGDRGDAVSQQLKNPIKIFLTRCFLPQKYRKMRRRQDEHGMSDAPYIIPDIVSNNFFYLSFHFAKR
jgi:hypothetical protein